MKIKYPNVVKKVNNSKKNSDKYLNHIQIKQETHQGRSQKTKKLLLCVQTRIKYK